ncbi:cell death-inducing p53-target protein 1 homolog isoform X8 [Xenia sp. Carnegie-2017]|uniref:cell death-inducing p53-target protein 1 homolog isoform X8 n=1 Tax=Xenia sp. Carnegie-2017 TaxID=2897299 RepID=UPI001F042359|nr:cell death-inducing p53-target protein 1 homolog isoform X8 [Xenia sp. Carnegie-2017]XP_046856816.1 cell death-inducing p53-target protein 1 homolog isoform X8 [Xenia sp. Carnegie-2017]
MDAEKGIFHGSKKLMEQPLPYSNEKENAAPYLPQQQEPLLGEHTEKYPPQGYPPQGYPPQGYPPQGYPAQGYPPQGYPPQGYPAQGYPPQGYPPQGYPLQQLAGMTQEQQNKTVLVQKQPQLVAVTIMNPIVNDHMGLSIFACLCCCWPIGIFAIIKSSESKNHYHAGNYDEAKRSAKTARNLAIIAIICGIILALLMIILRVATFQRMK